MKPLIELPRTLDFSALSTTVPLFSTSPAWPEVAAAIARLGEGGREPFDVVLVQQYAEMLTERYYLLKLALVVGGGLGSLVRSEAVGTRILKGLEAATAAGRLRAGYPQEMTAMLLRVYHELNLKADIPTDERFESGGTPSPQVARHFREIIDRISRDVDPTPIIQDAWLHWLHRWGSPSPVEASAAEMVCMAAGKGPAAWLRFRSEEMTINELSRATLQALGVVPPPREREGLPEAFALVGMRLLGFDQAVLDLLPLPGGRQPNVATALDIQGRTRQTGRVPSFIVVRPPQRPLWRGARPEPGVAILTMDGEEFSAAAHGKLPLFDILQEAAPDLRLVIGITEDGQDPPQIAKALRHRVIRSMERVDIYPGEPRGTPPRPFLVAPRSPVELRRWAQQHPGRKGAPGFA